VQLGGDVGVGAPAADRERDLVLARAQHGQALAGAARWLDGTRTLVPMTDHLMDATEWARAGTTLALWMVVPILVGLWRIAREEIA
jgi:hypothetical protein